MLPAWLFWKLKRVGFEKIIVGDSLIATLAINNQKDSLDWRCANIIADIRAALDLFQAWQASKIPRSANSIAHDTTKSGGG